MALGVAGAPNGFGRTLVHIIRSYMKTQSWETRLETQLGTSLDTRLDSFSNPCEHNLLDTKRLDTLLEHIPRDMIRTYMSNTRTIHIRHNY